MSDDTIITLAWGIFIGFGFSYLARYSLMLNKAFHKEVQRRREPELEKAMHQELMEDAQNAGLVLELVNEKCSWYSIHDSAGTSLTVLSGREHVKVWIAAWAIRSFMYDMKGSK